LDFFAETSNVNLYINGYFSNEQKVECNQRLLNYIKEADKELHSQIRSRLNYEQLLAQWQDAAYTALQLTKQYLQADGYTILSDVSHETTMGPKKVARVMCYAVTGGIDPSAVFSNGVHQCLHAELNRLMRPATFDPNLDENLKTALTDCKNKGRMFEIFPEVPPVVSTNSLHMLQVYDQGVVSVVSGTMGTAHEKNGLKNTKHIAVPRHKGINRFDKPPIIVNSEDDQINELQKQLNEAKNKSQPVLIFCKDDKEAKIIHKKISLKLQPNQLDLITAATDDATVQKLISNAGAAGKCLITTKRTGRGVDFTTEEACKKHGFRILSTFLSSTTREREQIIGRGGRYGEPGESRLILNATDLRKKWKIECNEIDDSYIDSDILLKQLQKFADHTAHLRREFEKIFIHFLETLQQYVSNNIDPLQWKQFCVYYNSAAEQAKHKILSELNHEFPNPDQIQKALSDFVAHIGTEFSNVNPPQENKTIALPISDELMQWMSNLKQLRTNNRSTHQITEEYPLPKLDYWDSKHAGKVHLFSSEGHKQRPLFANTRHYKQGKFFPLFRAWYNSYISFLDYIKQFAIVRLFIGSKKEAPSKIKIKIEAPISYVASHLVVDKNSVQPSTTYSTTLASFSDLRIATSLSLPPQNQSELFSPSTSKSSEDNSVASTTELTSRDDSDNETNVKDCSRINSPF